MAHAERLTQQVKSMSSRIKELEAALGTTQNGAQMHPLLRDAGSRDDLAVLDELESTFAAEMDEVSDTIGSLSISQDGKTRYHGQTTSSEVYHCESPDYYGRWLTDSLVPAKSDGRVRASCEALEQPQVPRPTT